MAKAQARGEEAKIRDYIASHMRRIPDLVKDSLVWHFRREVVRGDAGFSDAIRVAGNADFSATDITGSLIHPVYEESIRS